MNLPHDDHHNNNGRHNSFSNTAGFCINNISRGQAQLNCFLTCSSCPGAICCPLETYGTSHSFICTFFWLVSLFGTLETSPVATQPLPFLLQSQPCCAILCLILCREGTLSQLVQMICISTDVDSPTGFLIFFKLKMFSQLAASQKTVQIWSLVLCLGTVICFVVLHNPIHEQHSKQSQTEYWQRNFTSYTKQLHSSNIYTKIMVPAT